MSTLENKIETDACDLVWKHLGIEGSKLKVLGGTGYPDRIFWLPGGRPLLIEFKQPGETPTPKQAKTHNQLIKLGYQIEVHTNAVDAFQSIIDFVDSPQISKKVRKILVRARRCCAALRSRTGENSNYPRSN